VWDKLHLKLTVVATVEGKAVDVLAAEILAAGIKTLLVARNRAQLKSV
jgi:hypothetical protein